MEASELRKEAWTNYSKQAYVPPGAVASIQRRYDYVFEKCYLPRMPDDRSVKILEIGCNKGWCLMSLKKYGFSDLNAIDMTPQEVEYAKKYTGIETIFVADAFEYLPEHEGAYDVIILRAILEHIEKDRILEFLRLIKKALRQDGFVFIEVPNMDWLMSSHERYHDVTHESGFTIYSLKQIMGMVFEDIWVGPVLRDFGKRKISKLRIWILKPLAVFLIRKLFWILGEGMEGVLFEYRSIMGIGRNRNLLKSKVLK
jgi:2-polyprenyl-3-methyl-5-hydroxy-6-metoxy-1,4-benzoquinol methylase